MIVHAGKFLMMCVTAILFGDVTHIKKVKWIQVRDEIELSKIIAYLQRLKGLFP